jgi:hypothetical protein
MASTIDLNQSAFKHYQNGLSNSNIYACIGNQSRDGGSNFKQRFRNYLADQIFL